MTTGDLGTVTRPAANTGGWQSGPLNTRYRSVPSYTGDPTFEVIIGAPFSGHQVLAERILIQLPKQFYQQPPKDRAVVIGFHSFGVSEKDIFLNSALPWRCAQRKWMLVAPYGLTDTSFANPQSQNSLEAIGHVLYTLVPFNHRRVYGVGFSMGGLSALSYAMRHLDPRQLQLAGVVVHTAPMDVLAACEKNPLYASILFANWKHFGVDWRTDPFEYERISPVQYLQSGLVDADRAPVVNLLERPMFLHYNLADPDLGLVQGMNELRSFLLLRGADVFESLVYKPSVGHSWTTLPIGQALDFVGQYSLTGQESLPGEMFVDRPGKWLRAEVDSLTAGTFGRYRLELAPPGLPSANGFAVVESQELDQLRLNVAQLGLDATLPLSFISESLDGTPDTLVLAGYAAQPTSITVGGGAPDWVQHDPGEKSLSIRPTADGHRAVVDIVP